MLKTRAPASPGIGPEEGTRRAPIKSLWVNKLQSTKITTWPRRISECLSYICSLKKNTAIFNLFQLLISCPFILISLGVWFCQRVLINKSKETCLFTSSNVVYNTVDSAVSALDGQLLTQANTRLKPCSS